jgi:hypothetical protein
MPQKISNEKHYFYISYSTVSINTKIMGCSNSISGETSKCKKNKFTEKYRQRSEDEIFNLRNICYCMSSHGSN